MTGENVVVCFKGYTHAVFNLLQSSSVAASVGRYVRENLVEKEYIPEHMERGKNGGWYKVYGHWQQKYMYARYDMKAQKLFVPIAFCDEVCEVIRDWGARVEVKKINDYTPGKLNAEMRPGFTDRPKQIEPIKQCSDPNPGMYGLNLQTGGGKTYCAVKVAMNLGYTTLIIVPGLVDQWIEDIAEYTTARKRETIYKIEGFQSLAFLAQNPEYRPDFFVASTRTMQLFAKGSEGYDLLPWSYSEFFVRYQIGTKIVDECHKQFNANTIMDLYTNVQHNLYLSATFDQTSRSARKIFNRIFPEKMRYGGETYDKYVTVHFYRFYGSVLEKRCVRSKGYIHALYEMDLMKNDERFKSHVTNILLPLINQYYINRYQNGHRCLIFCSTVEFVTRLTNLLRTEYPDLRINSYTAGSTREVLEKSDLVVSTIGKASTGLDWKGLRCCINTVSVRSPVLTSQMLGRLRKINGETLIYVDMCDMNCGAQTRHAEDRIRDLSRMASKFYSYDGLNDLSIVG